jgi:hypothetical protein
LLHNLGGSRGLLDLKSRKLSVHNPDDLAITGLFVTLATT